MRMMNIALTATALSVAWCGQAWADDAKEKALEQKVEDLQKQLDEVSRRIGDGTNRSNDELEQRVAELEKVTKKDQDGMFAYWKNGLRLDSVDGAFKVAIFGRIQTDFQFWSSKKEVTDALGPTIGGEEFRRARLGVSGKMYKNVEWKAEYDFGNATGAAAFTDVFMQLDDCLCGAGGIPPINVRVGHFDEPMGLDHVTSSKYTTFTERSLLETFVPARNTGIMAFGGAMENRLAWFFGWFRDADTFGNDTGNTHFGEENWTGRITGRPYVSEDGTQFVHLGLSVSERHPSNEKVQFKSRPEVHQGPSFVDTGTLEGVDDALQFGLEAAGVFGPFHAQAEWNEERLHGKNFAVGKTSDDHTFDAQSVQVGYFLTGENREYDVPMARFDRIKVKRNYGTEGSGAWEVAARWSHIDLNDGTVEGGKLTDWTVGVNWYLNSNMKVMFDIIRAKRTDLPSIYTVVCSFRIDF